MEESGKEGRSGQRGDSADKMALSQLIVFHGHPSSTLEIHRWGSGSLKSYHVCSCWQLCFCSLARTGTTLKRIIQPHNLYLPVSSPQFSLLLATAQSNFPSVITLGVPRCCF